MAEKSALFVCLGNICRSPIAEAVMKQLVLEKGISDKWKIDSAATSTYQIGNPPDSRGQSCMIKHNIYDHVKQHRGRQITDEDFNTFDYIFGMDSNNMSDLKDMAPKRSKAKLLKLGEYDPDMNHDGTIRDPYYDGDETAFDEVYQQCLRSCTHFLKSVPE